MKIYGFALLLLIGVPIVAKGYSQERPQEQTQANAPSNSAKSLSSSGKPIASSKSNAPAAPDPQSNKSSRITVENIKDAAARKDGWDYAGVIIQGILALLAVIGGCLAFRSVKATEIAASAARDNAQAIVGIERAWILVKQAKSYETRFDWTIQNDGRTPAVIDSIRWGFIVHLHDEPLPQDPPYDKAIEGTPFVLAPGEPYPVIGFDMVRQTQDKVTWNEIRTTLQVPYFFCSIEYHSVITPKEQARTRFIRKYVPLAAPGFVPFDSPSAYTMNT